MMCDECKNNLGSWAKAELSAGQANRLEQHLAECESCSVAAHNELAIVTAMRESQEIPPSSPGFEKQVLDVAIGRERRSRKSLTDYGWSAPWVGGAIAAALVLGIALGFGWRSGQEPADELAQIKTDSVTDHRVTVVDESADERSALKPVARNVRLAFRSREALQGVTLTVELPPHVEVSDYPGHQRLSWRVDLDKGENVVNLPLNILFSGEGELVAHLDDGQRTKTFRASLNGPSINGRPEPSS